jgi:ABC-2 type transport system permease protein
MANDIATMVWKEFKEVIARSGKSRNETMKTVAVLAVIVGILVWRASFLANNLGALLVPSFAVVQLLAGVMADSFAGERERHTLETLLASRLSDTAIMIGKIAAGVLLAWGLIVLTVGLGVGAAYARHEVDQMKVSLGDVAVILLIYLLVCIVISCAAVLVSLRSPTVRQAMQTLMWSFMALFFLAIFGFARLTPESRLTLARTFAGDHLVRTEMIVIAGLAIVAVALFGAAKLRFQRARLILD